MVSSLDLALSHGESYANRDTSEALALSTRAPRCLRKSEIFGMTRELRSLEPRASRSGHAAGSLRSPAVPGMRCGACVVVLRRERSPFESARTAYRSVGAVSLTPPQPPAVAAASPRARGTESPDARFAVLLGPRALAAAGLRHSRQRAPVRLTGEHAPVERLGRASGSADRKRARAPTEATASETSVSRTSGASAGRCGATLARWNLHARTLGRTGNRAGLKGAVRSTR